ncbi:MAG: AEC family transporter [Verrucomicrobiaceae bacterium]
MSNLDFLSILSVAVPVYLTMAAGAVARRAGLLKPEADTSLMRLSVMLLTPALIIERVVGNESVMKIGPVAVAAGLGFTLVALSIGFTYFVAPLIGLKRGEGRRTFSVACGLQNYGFVAIPIVTALFPDKGTLGVLFTFTLGVEIACWTAGVGMLTGFDKAPWRLALNAPVITILGSLALNFTGLHGYVPQLAHNTFAMLGACAVPLAVLLIGASIADLIGQEKMCWNVALLSPVLRLGVLPFAFVAAAYYLPVATELKRILIVQAAMPSAVFNIMIARMYGGHAPTAVQVVIATTVVSCVTTPIVIAWGLKLVGA